MNSPSPLLPATHRRGEKMGSRPLFSTQLFSSCHDPFRCLHSLPYQSNLLPFAQRSSKSLLRFHPLRLSVRRRELLGRRGFGVVCYAAPLTPQNLQWICSVSSAVLLLAKGTAAQKSFLVPIFALQAPESVISWMKGEYGAWAAFLALLVRLFFFIPGELELPLVTLLLMIVAPYQALSLRGTQGGYILALVMAGYLAYQHFSRAGSLQKAFDQGSIVATLALVCVTVMPVLLLVI